MTVLAAVASILLAVNFHFWSGGTLIPFFNANQADGEGVDLDALIPAFSLILVVAHIAFMRTMYKRFPQKQVQVAISKA